jgi:hypothetical protein
LQESAEFQPSFPTKSPGEGGEDDESDPSPKSQDKVKDSKKKKKSIVNLLDPKG